MVLDEIVEHLHRMTGWVVDTDAGKLFHDRLPVTPDEAIAIAEYGGPASTYVQGTAGVSREMPLIQVLSRAKVYTTARQNAEVCRQWLNAVTNTALPNGSALVRYLAIRELGPPHRIGHDQNDRVLIAQNFQVDKEPS